VRDRRRHRQPRHRQSRGGRPGGSIKFISTAVLSDGLHDLDNLLYVDGQRLKVTRVVRRVGAGTCDVRLETAGSTALGATTTVESTRLARPYTVDPVLM
jgi:hypothetical protein